MASAADRCSIPPRWELRATVVTLVVAAPMAARARQGRPAAAAGRRRVRRGRRSRASQAQKVGARSRPLPLGAAAREALSRRSRRAPAVQARRAQEEGEEGEPEEIEPLWGFDVPCVHAAVNARNRAFAEFKVGLKKNFDAHKANMLRRLKEEVHWKGKWEELIARAQAGPL